MPGTAAARSGAPPGPVRSMVQRSATAGTAAAATAASVAAGSSAFASRSPASESSRARAADASRRVRDQRRPAGEHAEHGDRERRRRRRSWCPSRRTLEREVAASASAATATAAVVRQLGPERGDQRGDAVEGDDDHIRARGEVEREQRDAARPPRRRPSAGSGASPWPSLPRQQPARGTFRHAVNLAGRGWTRPGAGHSMFTCSPHGAVKLPPWPSRFQRPSSSPGPGPSRAPASPWRTARAPRSTPPPSRRRPPSCASRSCGGRSDSSRGAPPAGSPTRSWAASSSAPGACRWASCARAA